MAELARLERRSSAKLDSFQSWLLDQRSATPKSPFFKVFDGFATFVDDLVDWFTTAILWLTWLGAAAVGTHHACSGSAAPVPR